MSGPHDTTLGPFRMRYLNQTIEQVAYEPIVRQVRRLHPLARAPFLPAGRLANQGQRQA